MTDRSRQRPRFRAAHAGSFLRPERPLEAARAAKVGTLYGDGYRGIQDQRIA
jgi:hypothetical protein